MAPTASLVSLANEGQVPNSLGDGTQVGESTSSLVGFWGATPVVQPTGGTAAVTTTASTTTTPYGYATQAQADGIVALVNEIRAALVTVGFLAS